MTASAAGELTVTSEAGGASGKTTISVEPEKIVASNGYKYKLSATELELPELDDDLSAWADLDLDEDVTATNGYNIAVAEVTSADKCQKVGQTVVVSA